MKKNLTLSEKVYRQIREDIIHANLEPGMKLTIELLKKRYEIGASPLRESLNRLVVDGFVTSKGQRGFWVREVSLADLEDVTNVRILVENELLKQSITNGDDNWESNVVGSYHSLSKIEKNSENTDDNLIELKNNQFHNALLAASSSRRFQQIYNTLYDQHKRYRNLSRKAKSTSRDIHTEHKNIFNAVMERNIEKALSANEEHITKTANVVKKLMADDWND